MGELIKNLEKETSDPVAVLETCIDGLLKQGVSPLAIVEAFIKINAGLIHEAFRDEYRAEKLAADL